MNTKQDALTKKLPIEILRKIVEWSNLFSHLKLREVSRFYKKLAEDSVWWEKQTGFATFGLFNQSLINIFSTIDGDSNQNIKVAAIIDYTKQDTRRFPIILLNKEIYRLAIKNFYLFDRRFNDDAAFRITLIKNICDTFLERMQKYHAIDLKTELHESDISENLEYIDDIVSMEGRSQARALTFKGLLKEKIQLLPLMMLSNSSYLAFRDNLSLFIGDASETSQLIKQTIPFMVLEKLTLQEIPLLCRAGVRFNQQQVSDVGVSALHKGDWYTLSELGPLLSAEQLDMMIRLGKNKLSMALNEQVKYYQGISNATSQQKTNLVNNLKRCLDTLNKLHHQVSQKTHNTSIFRY